MANVLIIGSGGREHVLARELAKSEKVSRVWSAPGNSGSDRVGKRVNIQPMDFAGIEQLVRDESIDLTVVGPEAPLVQGIVDYFRAQGLIDEGHLIVGPTRNAAQLEGSKVFAKQFMTDNNIPTAPYETFTDPEEAKSYIQRKGGPIVVKADGLAGGKGVFPCQSIEQAVNAIDRIMVKKEFGDAGDAIVLEKFLRGREASVIALIDGRTIGRFVASQDHKAAFETKKDRDRWLAAGGDHAYADRLVGPNTGGMGVYAPAPAATPRVMTQIYNEMLLPTVRGMQRLGEPYQGFLFLGVMIEDEKAKLLEFNVRGGDPETQVILPMVKNDVYDLLRATATGELHDHPLEFKEQAAAYVVMAAGGYPGKTFPGRIIEGTDIADNLPDTDVILAGVELGHELDYETNGGRVLGVRASGKTVAEASKKAYTGVEGISFKGAYWRTDIGK